MWIPVFPDRDSIEASTRGGMEGASVPARSAFTDDHPLVYEDAWDRGPYSFINDSGEPVGFNIDLLKLIFKELDIPYIIKLKPTQAVLNDLKAGHADLTCALESPQYTDYARFGKSVVQIFTHSIVHHKGEQALIRSADDLAHHQIIVHQGGIIHHFMTEHGWGENAVPYIDMQDAVRRANNERGLQIVGNTLSLKWLLNNSEYDDLKLSPVILPHGEYKFMSNDESLLQQIDSVFTRLNSTGQLQPIQNKWFYPERKDTGIPSWVWYVIVVMIVIIVLFLLYYFGYRLYGRKMMKSVKSSNDRLSLILNTSKVHIWLFDIDKRSVTNIDEEGKKNVMPLSPNFGHYYMLPNDYERLCTLLIEMAGQKKERETMEFKVVKRNSKTPSIISADMSVMKRDRNGCPKVIIGATTDITKDRQRQQQQKDNMLRYKYIFNTALVDTVSYDEYGYIDDLNEKAANGLGGNIQRIVDNHISVQSVLGNPDLSLDDIDYTYLTQIYTSPDDERPLNKILGRDELYYELQMVPIRDNDGRLLGIYGTGRDVTEVAKTYSRLQKKTVKLQEATAELQDYMRNIDYVMKNGGVRIVNYSPDSHTLTIYSGIEQVQYRLTQTRLLSLVHEESKKTALRIMNNMDNLALQPVKAVIRSAIRTKEKTPFYLSFSFVPVTDSSGNVTEYFGMFRDISDLKATEKLLSLETKKAQEVETVKDAFLRNMCYEIRTPLTSVVGFAELIEKNPYDDDEKLFIEEIKKNSRNLLNLVNNILLISRLDAGMIEFKPEPLDFPVFFEQRCRSAWQNRQKKGVDYLIDIPYKHFNLAIDMTNMGVVIDQLIVNAVQHTTSGQVRARFDYNGEDLTVTVQDTGCGIPAQQIGKIFERFVTTHSGNSGLGLPICKEVVRLMGGKIRVKSVEGKGTIFWVVIPARDIEN